MFELMLLAVAVIAVGGLVVAYDGSRDVFHPMVFIGPMLAFLYAWMPFQLLRNNALARFFDSEQLTFVQGLNILGVLGFVAGCLIMGARLRGTAEAPKISQRTAKRLLVGSAVLGSIGVACWSVTILNVGGFTAAFSSSYSGGQDDSGYVRDGAMLLLVGLLLAVTSLSAGGPRIKGILLALAFGLPWTASALLMGRRGPTFNLVVVLLMGWYVNRRKRPPLLLVMAGGCLLGWFVLFLVTNRQQIYIGSSFDMKTDVSSEVEKPDTGNEYIYGTGTVLSADRRDHYFWMRRYLAQILVRPIPSAIWTTKYEDFGVPELLFNAGTGEGFGDTLGWVGANGSAPGIIADFWLEVWWFAPVLMLLVGLGYGFVWKRAVTRGGPWSSQYVVLAALSIYLVMQTGEAVIFRTLELSIPTWLAWTWALREPARAGRRRFFPARRAPMHAPVFAGRFAQRDVIASLIAPAKGVSDASMAKQDKQKRQKSGCRVAVIWIDWYPYHVARFRGLESAPELAGRTAGLEMVGGVGVHAGLKFREALPDALSIDTLLPDTAWREADKWQLVRMLWSRLNRLDPEVVLVPGYYTLPAIAAALWARLHGAASVLMTESCAMDHQRVWWKEKLKGLGLRALFNWAVTGGSLHVDYLRELGFPADRIEGCYDVVDNDLFRKGTEALRQNAGISPASFGLPAPPYFLYVGRLAEEKNVATLLQSWLAYRREGGTWPLVLVGDGPEAAALKAQAAASVYAGEVVFPGLKSSRELLPFYAFAGCFVLPSTREPWGLVVNEAMAASLPVIVSDRCGCVPELVHAGQNGLLFDPAAVNATASLTLALTRIATLPDEHRKHMGAASAGLISGFSPTRFGQSVATIARAARPQGALQTSPTTSNGGVQ